jgi:hypothetical protein
VLSEAASEVLGRAYINPVSFTPGPVEYIDTWIFRQVVNVAFRPSLVPGTTSAGQDIQELGYPGCHNGSREDEL